MNLGSIPDPWGPQELRVWQVEAELCIFNLNSYSAYQKNSFFAEIGKFDTA